MCQRSQVDDYIKQGFFRFAQSTNPLRKTAHLEGLHFETFSKQLSGKPPSFSNFVDFVRDLNVPGEMWVRFEPAQGESLAFSVYSKDNERLFKTSIREHSHLLVAGAGVAFAHLQRLEADAHVVQSHLSRLTPREIDCLLWCARGDRQQEISDRLKIDTKTVEMHLKNTRSKLEARTTTEAVAKAIVSGMITP